MVDLYRKEGIRMRLLRRISQWFDEAASLEREEHTYECELEYVKGYLGDKPKEKLMSLLTREQQYRLTLESIQSIAVSGIDRYPVNYYVNAILRQIKNMCDIPTNPQEKPELTP